MILMKINSDQGLYFVFHPDLNMDDIVEQGPAGPKFKSDYAQVGGHSLDAGRLMEKGFEFLSLEDLFEDGFERIVTDHPLTRDLGMNMMEAALTVYPEVPRGWLALAFGYKQNRDFAKAISCLENIFNLPEESFGGPEDRRQIYAVLYDELSFCHGQSGDRQKALEFAQKRYEQSPADAGAAVGLAAAYYELGDLEHARSYFSEAARLSPDDEKVRETLARIEEKLGGRPSG